MTMTTTSTSTSTRTTTLKTEVREGYVRARSAAEKGDRKQKILCAASTIILEGQEEFTIGSLARRSGIAKGTIYLYFKTKGDVLQHLFMEHVASWSEKMLEKSHGEMTETEFAEIFWSCTHSDELLMKLLTSSELTWGPPNSTDESIDLAHERKRLLSDLIELVEDCLALPQAASWFMISSLFALLIGSAHMDFSSVYSVGTRNAGCFRNGLTCQEMFLRNAPGIIASSRSRQEEIAQLEITQPLGEPRH